MQMPSLSETNVARDRVVIDETMDRQVVKLEGVVTSIKSRDCQGQYRGICLRHMDRDC